MPFDLFLLPLLGGFVFIRQFRYTQYATSRLSGQRLVIWTALSGVVGVVLSRGVVLLLLKFLPQAAEWWSFVLPFPLSGTAFGAFLIGCVAWCPANRAIKKQVQVTLEGGKVFVGYIMWQPLEPHKDNSYIGLLPMMSGYRDTANKQVNFTTNYTKTYEKLNQEDIQIKDDFDDSDFIKYFPVSAINIVSVFNPHIYMNWER